MSASRRPFLGVLFAVACAAASCAAPRVQTSLSPEIHTIRTKPLVCTYVLEQEGLPYVREEDSNGDGVLDRFSFRLGSAKTISRTVTQADLQKEGCKHLFLCMDAVPIETMKRLWDEGYFREFYPPSAMISPFPSMTFLSFSEIFNTAKPISYEERYFDRKTNQLKGGVFEHLHKDGMAEFYTLFDYQTPGIQGGTIYMDPKDVSAADFNRMKASFEILRTKRQMVAYVGGTDGLQHKLGEKGVIPFLKNVDLALREVFLESPEPLRITVFSDHGNNFVPSQRVPLDVYLTKHLGIGELDKRIGLKGRPSVVLPAYGLVNFAVIYTEDGREQQLATFLVGVRGVELVLFLHNGAAEVWGPRGKARVFCKEGPAAVAYKYEMVEGDPIDMKEVAEALKAAGKLDAAGFAADRDWFEATKEHKYVDAVHRLYEAAVDLVQNKANLVIGLEDGYYYGNKSFEMFCKLQGTHGGLSRGSTLGFAMTNYKTLPPYLRGSDMSRALGLPKKR